MKKHIITLAVAVLLLAALLLPLASCQSVSTKIYRIGICQLTQHAALDAATKGFRDALTAELGDVVTFDEQNAAGDSNVCSTIVNAFVSKKYDLILANATPALQAAYNATETIPILGTSITEYGVALHIDNFDGTVGGNVSGTSDLANLTEQAQMILDWIPGVKTVGLLSCSAEANSAYQIGKVAAYLTEHAVTVKEYTFSDSNDVAAVTERACAECDALYIPTDNTAAACAETIGNIVRNTGTPLIAGEQGICSACGIATLSIDYYELGYTTGLMAAKILRGESKISEMPIEYAPTKKLYNAQMCELLGITPLDGYTALD